MNDPAVQILNTRIAQPTCATLFLPVATSSTRPAATLPRARSRMSTAAPSYGSPQAQRPLLPAYGLDDLVETLQEL